MGRVADGAELRDAVVGAAAASDPASRSSMSESPPQLSRRPPKPTPVSGATDVLVIGGAGFIGSHLVDRLVAEQLAVEVVDDLSSGSLANLTDARAAARQAAATCASTRSTPTRPTSAR